MEHGRADDANKPEGNTDGYLFPGTKPRIDVRDLAALVGVDPDQSRWTLWHRCYGTYAWERDPMRIPSLAEQMRSNGSRADRTLRIARRGSTGAKARTSPTRVGRFQSKDVPIWSFRRQRPWARGQEWGSYGASKRTNGAKSGADVATASPCPSAHAHGVRRDCSQSYPCNGWSSPSRSDTDRTDASARRCGAW